MTADLTLHVATIDQLDAPTLYRLLRLRSDVFVVEQGDPYPELDGRDLEPTAVHLWLTRGDDPVGYLRILDEPDGAARIGRVVVAPDARGAGLAGRLMSAALERIGARRCVLAAQVQLGDFYARYGFSVTGPEFLDGSIPHLPMARPAPQ
ncbi:GNAT family N-acetyltransferase [Jiangella rhizosphaerae]|uniref:GNAT family N-acetyltransferase n=1 Tax=Jiangella rhizosphaerae TaxID=2293569 RepID=A0A418KJM8_9ACTN|nr:GNAT family N-acetyltransferase [Jiangella rhizosphaerae]RIQ14428.1 GNAT family N-acetyltransferase [Jiangella rhizosphaerae]